jgi:butyryl-CoA dehydrogenase
LNYFLTDEQRVIQELARKIAVEKVIPVRQELDEKEEFPWEIMKVCWMLVSWRFDPRGIRGFGGGARELCGRGAEPRLFGGA